MSSIHVYTCSGYSAGMTSHPAGELRSFAPADVALYHRNPRVGDVSAIQNSLRAHGQYRPIVVNAGTHTGRPNEVLAGNHTVKAFRNLQEAEPDDPRWRTIAAFVIDVDDDRAARIVLADNRTAELGGYDDASLLDLLRGLPDLDGTAYTQDDMGDLMAKLEESLPPITDGLEPGDDNAVPKPPRLGEDGLIASNDLDTDRELYSQRATRLVVLTLGIPQFIWAQERMTELRERYGVETNTEVFVRLLEDATDSTAPADETDGVAVGGADDDES